MAELLRGLPFLWIKMHYAMMGFVQGYNVPVYKVMTLTAYAYSFLTLMYTWFDTINLEWSIVYVEGLQAIIF